MQQLWGPRGVENALQMLGPGAHGLEDLLQRRTHLDDAHNDAHKAQGYNSRESIVGEMENTWCHSSDGRRRMQSTL